jgi:hypothetical protein
MKIESQASLQVIENKKVICKNCLISEPSGIEGEVTCCLEPDPKPKKNEQFCAQGAWLIGDGVYDFKSAFAIAYRDQAQNNTKKIGEEHNE